MSFIAKDKEDWATHDGVGWLACWELLSGPLQPPWLCGSIPGSHLSNISLHFSCPTSARSWCTISHYKWKLQLPNSSCESKAWLPGLRGHPQWSCSQKLRPWLRADQFLNCIFYFITYVGDAHVCPSLHTRVAYHLGIPPGAGSDSCRLHCCQQ